MKQVININDVSYLIEANGADDRAIVDAFGSVSTNIIWITEEITDKRALESIRDLVKEKVRAIISLGKEKTELINSFHKNVEIIVEAVSLEEAVSIAALISMNGESVLYMVSGKSLNETEFIEATDKLKV